MPEEVLFESEQRMNRAEIAASLRKIVEKLEAGEPITLSGGGESVTLDPPTQPTFEVKAEREGPVDGSGELSVEFEIEWPEEGGEEGGLEIG
jgi:amphi-Trp domain-containing protein